jgi:hypothetical protein
MPVPFQADYQCKLQCKLCPLVLREQGVVDKYPPGTEYCTEFNIPPDRTIVGTFHTDAATSAPGLGSPRAAARPRRHRD